MRAHHENGRENTMLISEMASMLAMSRLIPISTGPSKKQRDLENHHNWPRKRRSHRSSTESAQKTVLTNFSLIKLREPLWTGHFDVCIQRVLAAPGYLKRIPTIEIGSEVAVVSLHQLLDGGQQLRVVPLAPVVAGMHAASAYRLTASMRAVQSCVGGEKIFSNQ